LDDGGASGPTIHVDRALRAQTQPPSVTVIIGDSDPTTVEIDPNGAEIVNPFLLTSLRITKTIAGEGAELATRDFVFRIDCVQVGRRFAPITATIDRPDQTEVVVDGLPVGALCAVFEIDDGGADEDDEPRLVGLVSTQLPTQGEPIVTVDATNTFSAGRVVIAKLLQGPGAGAAATSTFDLLLTCERPGPGGTFEPLLSETITVTAAEPVVLDQLVPIGSRCWAAEVDDGGATSVVIDHDSVENAAIVTLDAPVITITATNTFEVGDLLITKVVTGPGAPFADRPFTFTVDCTLGGRAQPPVTVSIAPPATSVTVPGLSTGAECSVTETDAGGADGPAVVEPSAVVIGAPGQPAVTATATNTYSVGHVSVAKVVTGPGALAAAGRTFALQVVCQRPTPTGFTDVLRTTVTVTAAAPVAVDGNLPIGSRCWATETDSNGATTSSVDFGAPTAAAVVTLQAPAISITATNSFGAETGGETGGATGGGTLPATGPSRATLLAVMATIIMTIGIAMQVLTVRRPHPADERRPRPRS
ncbi:MAG: DUF5979 domain-containing protein, partial [Ilumatobacteraceae bacterium]